MDKAKTKSAIYEVLDSHLVLKGDAANAHLAKYFDAVWDHSITGWKLRFYDVNKTGALEAVELNHFMRDLCKLMSLDVLL